ncbi:MAG: hypothetical protein HY753_01365 [Nitrospirae bacterium]|nr:hypothetical protein [Nitrospirota bacterium]
MVPRIISLLAVVIIFASCAHTGKRMSQISIGMNKVGVIQALGNPRSVGGKNNIEVLHYRDDNGFWQYDYYYVRLVDDKVESYGIEYRGHPVTDSNPPVKLQ